MKKLSLLFCSIGLLVSSCMIEERNQDDYTSADYQILSESLTLPKTISSYELDLGEHYLPTGKTFPKINITSFAEIRDNNNKATLGRVLFFDKYLSKDGEVSCGSCHDPKKAFSDDGQFSEGVGSTITKRNSLALATTLSFKISYNPLDPSQSRSRFSWDDSASNLEQQVKNAFRNENEMDVTEGEIIERITKSPFYPILFKKAFGDEEVTEQRIAQSITAFIDAISSNQSKFDRGLENSPGFNPETDFYEFTDDENEGKKLYNLNCASCHTSKHNFTVKATANNGLDMVYEDKGIGGRLNLENQFGVFKVPFLRNVGLTAPYMHDGRFATLEDVVEHYNSGIQNHKNLSPELKLANGNAKKLNLSKKQKDQLVAYLHTLTDYSIISDKRFSNPFK